MRLLFTLHLLTILARTRGSDKPRGLQDGVADGGRPSNPGFKVRITEAALNYAATLATNAMKTRFSKVRISDIYAKVQNGDVHLSDMTITKFQVAEQRSIVLHPSDQVSWSAEDADISVHGLFDARLQMLLSKLVTQGDFDANANRVNFSIRISLYKSSDGGVVVKSRQCNSSIKSLNANFRASGLGNAMLNLYKPALLAQIRPQVAAELCKQATHFVDEELNKRLATLPKKIPLNSTKSGDSRDADTVTDDDYDSDRTPSPASSKASNISSTQGALLAIARDLSKHLVLDYGLLSDPIVTPRYVETSNKGEISYEGTGGTPFYPVDLREPQPVPSNRMMYLIASDYVLNSMFWHAFKHGMITFRANARHNPDFKTLLKTSCDDGFDVCLGALVPEVSTSYPNSDAEILFQATQAPATFFLKNGTIKIIAPSYVVAYARKNNELREMLTADVDVEAVAKVWIDGLLCKVNGTITKFNMNIRNNHLKNFTQPKMNEFANMAKAMFQDLANTELQKGLPLPTIKGTRLVNPQMKIFERTARVETDLVVDEEVLIALAADALRHSDSGQQNSRRRKRV